MLIDAESDFEAVSESFYLSGTVITRIGHSGEVGILHVLAQRCMGPKQLGLALEEVGFRHPGEVKAGLVAILLFFYPASHWKERELRRPWIWD